MTVTCLLVLLAVTLTAGSKDARAQDATTAPRQPALAPAPAPKAAPSPASGERNSTAPVQESQKAEPATKPAAAELKRSARKGTTPANAAPSRAFATCEEPQNDNGLRVIVMPPSANNVRLAIFERGGRLIEQDVFTPTRDATVGYARVLWGTRNTPVDRLQKGAFLIKSQQKDRFMQGTILADGGDGSFMIREAYLGRPDPDARRWAMRLGGERTLTCRVGGN